MVRISEARRSALTIYFVFGFAVIAWVPRIPEIKTNIGVSAAAFGALTSLGTIGAICSAFIASRVIHRIGSQRAIALFGSGAFSLVALLPFLRQSWVYGLVILIYGMCTNSLSTGLNIQSLHIEEHRGLPSMGAFHGLWAAGALTTSITSTLAVSAVPLPIQLPAVSAVTLTVLWSQLPR